jgi:hypothetical protein
LPIWRLMMFELWHRNFLEQRVTNQPHAFAKATGIA